MKPLVSKCFLGVSQVSVPSYLVILVTAFFGLEINFFHVQLDG